MWFELKGDARLGRCATEDCGGQPIWRFEAHGVGSSYCSGCKEKIGYLHPTCVEADNQQQMDEAKDAIS